MPVRHQEGQGPKKKNKSTTVGARVSRLQRIKDETDEELKGRPLGFDTRSYAERRGTREANMRARKLLDEMHKKADSQRRVRQARRKRSS